MGESEERTHDYKLLKRWKRITSDIIISDGSSLHLLKTASNVTDIFVGTIYIYWSDWKCICILNIISRSYLNSFESDHYRNTIDRNWSMLYSAPRDNFSNFLTSFLNSSIIIFENNPRILPYISQRQEEEKECEGVGTMRGKCSLNFKFWTHASIDLKSKIFCRI